MSKITRRTFVSSALGLVSAAPFRPAAAQERRARIGFITAQQAASIAPNLAYVRAGLAGEGLIEGQNLTIEYRYGDDSLERAREAARELAASGVDLILAQGSAVSQIAALDLPTPLVYVMSADPISAGFAESLARPIGAKTGLTFMVYEFASKRLEILREMMPQIERVAVFGNPEHMGTSREREFSEDTGRRLGIDVGFCSMSQRPDVDEACRRVASEKYQAISLLADGFAVQNRKIIIDFAASQGVPVMSGWPVFAESGGLFTYGPRLNESYRRLAYYVARILRGTRPQDLPIERPSVFHTVVNLKTAQKLGIVVPRSLLARADEVIG
jgi:putative ABC transport system substrate-binding protein